jgi:hypothetical protein
LKTVLSTEKRKLGFIFTVLFVILAIVPASTQIPASYAATLKILASGQGYPTAIVQNGKYVYWSAFGNQTINSVDKTGGSIQVIIPDNSGAVNALQVSGGFVYWTTPLGLYKVATNGGSVTALYVGPANGAVVSGTTIYFIGENNIYEISTSGTNLKEIVSGQSLGTPLTLIKEGNYLVTYNFGNGSIAFISLITGKVVSQPYAGTPGCSDIIESGIVNMFYASGFVYFTETGVCSTYEIGILGKVSMTGGEENLYTVQEPQVGALLNGIALLPGATKASGQIVFCETVPGEDGVYSLPLTGSPDSPTLLFSLVADGITVASKVIYATGSSEVVSYA